MPSRRKSTAEAVIPEQETATRTGENRPRNVGQPGEAERGGNGNAQQSAPEPRPNGPVPVEPMAQNRNGADLEERIRLRAYELYEARGRQDGHAEDDWLLAEEEITGITGGG